MMLDSLMRAAHAAKHWEHLGDCLKNGARLETQIIIDMFENASRVDVLKVLSTREFNQVTVDRAFTEIFIKRPSVLSELLEVFLSHWKPSQQPIDVLFGTLYRQHRRDVADLLRNRGFVWQSAPMIGITFDRLMVELRDNPDPYLVAVALNSAKKFNHCGLMRAVLECATPPTQDVIDCTFASCLDQTDRKNKLAKFMLSSQTIRPTAELVNRLIPPGHRLYDSVPLSFRDPSPQAPITIDATTST
jgi:hypothetical protein